MSMLWATSMGSVTATAQGTPDVSNRTDTAKTLAINVHPQMIGGAVPLGSNGGAVFRASAAIQTRGPRHQSHLTIDLLQSAGTPLLRAAQAGYDRSRSDIATGY